jgi:hypothetical protein
MQLPSLGERNVLIFVSKENALVFLEWEIVNIVIAIPRCEVQKYLVHKVWDRFIRFNARFVKVAHQFGVHKKVIPPQITSREIQSVIPELIKVILDIGM